MKKSTVGWTTLCLGLAVLVSFAVSQTAEAQTCYQPSLRRCCAVAPVENRIVRCKETDRNGNTTREWKCGIKAAKKADRNPMISHAVDSTSGLDGREFGDDFTCNYETAVCGSSANKCARGTATTATCRASWPDGGICEDD